MVHKKLLAQYGRLYRAYVDYLERTNHPKYLAEEARIVLEIKRIQRKLGMLTELENM